MAFLEGLQKEIAARRWTAVFRKIRKLFAFLLVAPACVPLVLCIRLIRPFVRIRFTWIPCRLLGHAVFEPDVYLSQQAVGLLPEPKIHDLYYFEDGKPSNTYWKRVVERHLPITRFHYYLAFTNRLFPGWQAHYRQPYAERYSTADPDNLLGKVGPQIKLTSDEDRAGTAFLRRLGINSNAKFVCVQVRDSAHDVVFNPAEVSSSYCEYRNSNIENYVPAMDYLTQRGYWVLRMGKLTAHPLKTGNPMIIDYSNSGLRTEFLDIWLCFNCTFMLSTGSGIDAVAAIARKPIVCVDFLAYLDTTYFFRNSIIIYKHLHNRRGGEKLSLRDIVRLESETYYKNSDFYWSRGVEWRSNTPQEIMDAVKELDDRLTGTWVDTDSDVQLQARAAQFIAEAPQYRNLYGGGFAHRIGTQYLRDDPAWLE